MARPDPAPDPFDAGLSAVHDAVERPRRDRWDADLSVVLGCAENIGPWLSIWTARTEPDPSARTCAGNAIDSIDAMLYALHRIRARLVTETRQADDQAAARVDALLARMRDGPRP
jgi:hypothetical protein